MAYMKWTESCFIDRFEVKCVYFYLYAIFPFGQIYLFINSAALWPITCFHFYIFLETLFIQAWVTIFAISLQMFITAFPHSVNSDFNEHFLTSYLIWGILDLVARTCSHFPKLSFYVVFWCYVLAEDNVCLHLQLY